MPTPTASNIKPNVSYAAVMGTKQNRVNSNHTQSSSNNSNLNVSNSNATGNSSDLFVKIFEMLCKQTTVLDSIIKKLDNGN